MLTVSRRQVGQAFVVELLGYFYNADKQNFLSSVSSIGENPFIIDLSELTYLSPEGLSALVVVIKTYDKCMIILPNMRDSKNRVRNLIEQTGLTDFLSQRAYKSIEKALKSIQEE